MTGADGCLQVKSLQGEVPVEIISHGMTAAITQDVTADRVVAFETETTTVQFVSSSGAPISGAEVRYFLNGLNTAVVTDRAVQVTVESTSSAGPGS